MAIAPQDRRRLPLSARTDVEADGLVVFLRSLTPKSQGELDFGGHGGGGHHDGGAGPTGDMH